MNRRTGSHFLDSLSGENFDLLKSSIAPVSLARHAVLARPGEEVDTVWFPTTAVLSVVTVLKSGQEVETCTIGHESAFGLLNALGAPTAINRVVAQVPGKALRMPALRLKAAAALSGSIANLIVRHAKPKPRRFSNRRPATRSTRSTSGCAAGC